MAEIADISRFSEDRRSDQYVSLTWQKRSSGDFVSQQARMTKVRNTHLRCYVILGAHKVRRSNLEDKTYYWCKPKGSAKYRHKRAFVLWARKLVRLMPALLTRNVAYVTPRTMYALEGDGSPK